MTSFDATAVVRKALDDARAAGCAGPGLMQGFIDRIRPHVHKFDPDAPGDVRRLAELADATRAIVWHESGHEEYARLSG